jgi:hypothetical protein
MLGNALGLDNAQIPNAGTALTCGLDPDDPVLCIYNHSHGQKWPYMIYLCFKHTLNLLEVHQ